MGVSSKSKPRVLFVAMADSVHTARYISTLKGTDWDIHLFPVYYCTPHEKLVDVTVWNMGTSYCPPQLDPSVRMRGIWPFKTGSSRFGASIIRILDRSGFNKEWQLRLLIQHLKPDIIHSLEFQKAGYLVERVKSEWAGDFPLWIATNWGSDIYAFGNLPEHSEKIRRVLGKADVYSCECVRDVLLAKKFGFSGKVMSVVPNTGGFDLAHCEKLRSSAPPSKRKVVAVKGYQYSFGRSLVALRALERVAPLLKGYKIVLYSPYPKEVVEIPALLMAQRSGLNLELMESVPHDEILRLHGRSRFSISLSISDAICTSMTEAMVMGSLPIQSDSACTDEWVEHGRSALTVNADDSDDVAEKISLALTDDALVDSAAAINRATAIDRLDTRVITASIVSEYEQMLDGLAFRKCRNP